MGPGTTLGGKRYIRQAAVKIYARKRIKALDIKSWETGHEDVWKPGLPPFL